MEDYAFRLDRGEISIRRLSQRGNHRDIERLGIPYFKDLDGSPMPSEKTLSDLFLDTLKDIYFAEKQILKALPKLARAAQSEEGKAAFLQHREETHGQIERLEQIFELLGKPARGKTCEAIQGILAEGEEILEEYKGTAALDAGLISSAQAVEHYEIARYGTLKSWAKQLGLKEAIPLLDANLQEEIATDQKLTALGEALANTEGMKKAS
ncbi:ferritin-like metal-binding protein YciE [Rhizobium taibaishanense]|uniref:Ferritin-like metal-binding protein YciE n=2 Tax=Allorhizobium taibaishanense TaxID=887144 RepID=A0A7W6HMW5_9HYPH|nr:ferritin-like metal-binding protein YciE [Allorhizobium taibaishanense]